MALLCPPGSGHDSAADHADPQADAEPGDDDDQVEAILAHKHVSGGQLCCSSRQVMCCYFVVKSKEPYSRLFLKLLIC